MNRQNLFSDEWDGENEEGGTRHRIFWRPDDARMGATLYELVPDAPEMRMHMHFGAEEMFFVLSGRPVLRNHDGEEKLGNTLTPGMAASPRRTTRPAAFRQDPHHPDS